MVQKKLRILLAETEPSETADTLRALFPEASGRSRPDGRLDDGHAGAHREDRRSGNYPARPRTEHARSTRRRASRASLGTGDSAGRACRSIAKTIRGTKPERRRDGLRAERLHGRANARPRTASRARTQHIRRPRRSPARSDDGPLHARRLQTLGSRCMEEARRTGESMVLICALFENLNMLRDGFGPGAADHASVRRRDASRGQLPPQRSRRAARSGPFCDSGHRRDLSERAGDAPAPGKTSRRSQPDALPVGTDRFAARRRRMVARETGAVSPNLSTPSNRKLAGAPEPQRISPRSSGRTARSGRISTMTCKLSRG